MEATLDKAAESGAAGAQALRHQLRDLYDEVADLLDDDQVEAFPNYFVEDCLYKVTSRENFDQGLPGALMYCDGVAMLRDRILAIRETQVYEPRSWRHFISGVRVLGEEGGRVTARANFLVTEAMSDEAPRVFLVGRYRDVLERQGDRLLFREHIAVCDNHSIRRSLIIPV
jgi:anthranilate 1,2-dioxygenase small subunit